MKKFILLVCITLAMYSYGQDINGTYVNAVGQELVITHNEGCCFQFEVTWGVDDEWGCLFTGSGNATYIDDNSAYAGESADWADIDFMLNGDIITIIGGYEYIGGDCARYGDSSEDRYTEFKKID